MPGNLALVAGVGALAGALAGIAIGYLVGRRETTPPAPESDLEIVESSDEDEGEDGIATELSEEVKMVLCVRMDLKMGKGKMCAQCGHAALGMYRHIKRNHNVEWKGMLQQYMRSQPKIALKVPDSEAMGMLHDVARAEGLPCVVIRDAGRTQIAAGSATVLAILGFKSAVDRVTGHLKLL